MDNKTLRNMAKQYLENGVFDVSGYAMIEKRGVEFLAEDGDMDEDTIREWVKGDGDFDGLSDWAHELGVFYLSASEEFVLRTLDVSTHEQRLRYQAEMSDGEKELFGRLYREMFEEVPDWLKS